MKLGIDSSSSGTSHNFFHDEIAQMFRPFRYGSIIQNFEGGYTTGFNSIKDLDAVRHIYMKVFE